MDTTSFQNHRVQLLEGFTKQKLLAYTCLLNLTNRTCMYEADPYFVEKKRYKKRC